MSLGSATPVTMDLAAFRLEEIEVDRREGVFRHRRSLRALMDRALGRETIPVAPPAQRDPFAWLDVADLIPIEGD